MNKPKTEAVAVECFECSKKFKTRKVIPECPRCGGVDIDVRAELDPLDVAEGARELSWRHPEARGGRS